MKQTYRAVTHDLASDALAQLCMDLDGAVLLVRTFDDFETVEKAREMVLATTDKIRKMIPSVEVEEAAAAEIEEARGTLDAMTDEELKAYMVENCRPMASPSRKCTMVLVNWKSMTVETIS